MIALTETIEVIVIGYGWTQHPGKLEIGAIVLFDRERGNQADSRAVRVLTS